MVVVDMVIVPSLTVNMAKAVKTNTEQTAVKLIVNHDRMSQVSKPLRRKMVKVLITGVIQRKILMTIQ